MLLTVPKNLANTRLLGLSDTKLSWRGEWDVVGTVMNTTLDYFLFSSTETIPDKASPSKEI